MSQVDQPATRPAPTDASHSCRAPSSAASARAAPPVQARQQFDAALQRAHERDDEPRPEPRGAPRGPADTRPPRRVDTESEPRDPFGPVAPLAPFAGLQHGLPPAALAGADALLGGAPLQVPVSPSHAGFGAEAQAGQTIGGARQYSLNLPGDQSAAALSLRLTQAGPQHWHLRLGADAATRQQLAPHVERLRDRLRQRQGSHTADFELDDEAG